MNLGKGVNELSSREYLVVISQCLLEIRVRALKKTFASISNTLPLNLGISAKYLSNV